MTIVDTTVWVDYLRGSSNPETSYLDRILAIERLGLTDLILCEVLQGVDEDSSAARVLRELRRFEIFETGSQHVAVESAKNFRTLRFKGRTVRKTIDCLIATFCLAQGHSLLHRDRDFDHFEQVFGLRVIHP
jgi:predicted nucleic acid-binding protein